MGRRLLPLAVTCPAAFVAFSRRGLPTYSWDDGARGFAPSSLPTGTFNSENTIGWFELETLRFKPECPKNPHYEEMKNMNAINHNPNWKPDYRQACGILTTYRGEKPMILVVRRSALEDTCQGLWEVAGGKVDEGETIYWTARTELLEETGLDRSPTYMATDYDYKKKKAYHLFVDAHFTEPEVTLSFEHDAYKWISLGELRQWVQDEPETISHHLAHWVEHCIATDTLHEQFTYTTMVDGVPFRTWSPASLFF